MARLSSPKYMKIYDLQKILKYVFVCGKRPHCVQFNPKPAAVAVVHHTEAPQPGTAEVLEALGYLRIHVNESMPAGEIFRNILKAIDVKSVSLDVITPVNLELVEKHDTIHLFSYSNFIRSQTALDETIFTTFVRPHIMSPYFLVAVDCEMVRCEHKMEVGRVSLLDHTGKVIYDKFVKPQGKVVDYLEQYSGLNEDNTSGGITPEELSRDVLSIIGTNTYVLGHGLENDLGALNLYTDKVIDTAYLFLNMEGYKVKLSELTKKYLGNLIQEESHCPIEDAMSCLRLLAFKIAQLKNFYDPTGRVLNLGVKLERCEIDRIPRRRGLFLCEVAKLDIDLLRQREDVFFIVLYEIGKKSFVALRQTTQVSSQA